jgi:hypothetical protein
MIPDQAEKPYLRAIERSDTHASSLAADLRDGMRRFWADPVTEAPKLDAEAAAAGLTSEELFDLHGAAIQWLLTAKPTKMAWLQPTPIQTPFNPDGSIDRLELAVRWSAYLAALPSPE